jgi:hypothetical protein
MERAALGRTALSTSLMLCLACGGSTTVDTDSVAAPDGVAGADARPPAPQVESSAQEDPCACPTLIPDPGDSCSCPDLTCQFSPHYCWRGQATCREGTWTWDYPDNTLCPAELPDEIPTYGTFGMCNGRGSCEYDVDVGCGPAPLTITCGCFDAQFAVTGSERPPLCDCAVIASRGLCEAYGADCDWNQELESCVRL